MKEQNSFKFPEVVFQAGSMLHKIPRLTQQFSFIAKNYHSQRLSIGSFIEKNARKYPSHPAILYEDQRYTHQEFNAWINRYANYLISRGLRKGDAVAVLLENRPEILVCVAAIVKIGAIAAMINTSQRKNVLIHSFTLCSPKMCIIGEELLGAFEEVKNDLKDISTDQLYFVQDQGKAAPSGYTNLTKVTQEISETNPSTTSEVKLKDPCFYIYTSGTTGLPKASIAKHYRWVFASVGLGGTLNLKPGDVFYCPLPLFHHNGLTVSWSAATAAGAAMAIRRKFSASQFWDDTRKFQASAFCYIGELCRYLMNQPLKPDDADNPVTKMLGNGLRYDIWQDFKKRFGISEVYEFYGASESTVFFFNVFNLDHTVGFCPTPYAIVKYDIDGDEPVLNKKGFMVKVKPGEVGLLLGKVTKVIEFDGYTDKKANDKKLLKDVFKKGDLWYNSGDLLRDVGYRHAQFVDRLGDTFRWKGENVSTTMVEEALNAFGQINETTVYGVQIPGTDGRAGMASIVSNVPVDQFDLEGLASLLKKELPVYAIPVFIRIQTELEVTGTFKHRKVDLKKEGFVITQMEEPVYVWLPRATEYVLVDENLHDEIQKSKYRF